ncbi:MAG TPA: hypothetical protein PLV25_00445, partial [Opitutales bacterium]|nr:hypothetical protein [Opitutales bacterium]
MEPEGPGLLERPPRRMRGRRERVRTYRPAPWGSVPEAPRKNRLEIGVVALLATLAIHAVVLLV